MRKEVVEALTTNETFFFRDFAPFQAFSETVLPELRQRNTSTQRIRIWSAAASSGQEAYSLAMLLSDAEFTGWDVRVIGTDIAQGVLTKAQRGRYTQLEVNRGLPVSHLVRHFTQIGHEWQVNEDVRQLVEFRHFDLRESAQALDRFDVIFCRNVLIYFDGQTKKKILQHLRAALKPEGYLFLGAAETVQGFERSFDKKTAASATFYQAV